MEKTKITYVTIEEAVAKMINMDYIPDGMTMEEMLCAFKEEARSDYENAKTDQQPEEQIDSLRTRYEVNKAREALALTLLKDLQDTLNKSSFTPYMRTYDSTNRPTYMLEIIVDWVSRKYGITIPEWPTAQTNSSVSTESLIDMEWEHIEIRIRKDDKIAFSYKSGPWYEKSFFDINLIDKKTQKPNRQGSILVALSMGMKFPKTTPIANNDKASISKLRNSLKKLTGIQESPFYKFNETDGWKPRFKIYDYRNNADERARKSAIHEKYEDDRLVYDQDNDIAGKWLDGND